MSMSKSDAGRLGAEKTNALWKKRYDESPSHCEHCSCKLPYEKRNNKFCDQSCSASHNNAGVRRNGDKGDKHCLHCGTQLVGRKYVNTYCSMKCNKEYLWEQKKKAIKKSGLIESVSIARRYLLDTSGNKCSVCDTLEWCGRELVLVVDHINGNPEDWRVTNKLNHYFVW